MIVDADLEFNIIRNRTTGVRGAIGVVDGNRIQKLLGVDLMLLNDASVYDTSCTSTVDKGFQFDGMSGVQGSDFYLCFELSR